MPRKDLIGQQFGRLTVIEFLGTVTFYNSKTPKAHWKCLCLCGNTTITTTDRLTSGHRQTCGCRIGQKKAPHDISGKRFGRLVVLSYLGRRKGCTRWRCQCDCGNITECNAHNLKSGSTVSCGCWRIEWSAAMLAQGRETRGHAIREAREAPERTCRTCGKTKPTSDFIDHGGRGIHRRCATCRRHRHSIRVRLQRQAKNLLVRQAVIAHYGPTCRCCGEANPYFLQIDHINGGGTQERKMSKLGGTRFYEYLIKQGFPEGFRILCSNCNSSFGHFGYCPHDHLFHPIEPHEVMRRYFWRRKLTTLMHYGAKCRCCGELFPEFLHIDHIKGGGRQEQRNRRTHFYNVLKSKGYPQKPYRCLCVNCNSSYGFFGFCPHTKEGKQLRLL